MSISKKDSRLVYETIQNGEKYGGNRVSNKYSWVAKMPTKVFGKDSIYDCISFAYPDISIDDLFVEEKNKDIHVYTKGD